MKANLDKTIEIKSCDAGCYHVEHTRIIVDPSGKHPTKNKRIAIYFRREYANLLRFVEKNGLGAMNDDEIRVVHDPVLQDKINNEAILAEEKKRLAAEKKKPGPKQGPQAQAGGQSL